MSSENSKQYHAVNADEVTTSKVESVHGSAKPVEDDEKKEKQGKKETKFARSIRVMTILQSMLSALLSLAIAVWQGRVYVTYQRTKDMPGAWPTVPNLAPTILLLVIAVAAFVFDLCMLLAYLMPNRKQARWALTVGNAAYYVVTSAKTVSYAISSAISKTSFDFGNATNQNSDLWSWTCTDQAATQDSVTQAESNCATQQAAWCFALAQLAVEAFKWLISILGWIQKMKQEEKDSVEAQNQKFSGYSPGVDQQLANTTPMFETSGLGV
ncbi:hypothetical protein BX600DRAFT_513727 [Xylariales sp. PMI_506]|nr:hypothetical protein BX600DRAFT_513727 [Xylariales sp. PMI_506]